MQQTSCEAVETLSKVLKFKEETENQIRDTFGRRASNAVILFHNLLKRPATSIEQVMEKCGLSYKSANDLVKDFVKNDILEETTGQSRNRFFRMKPYLEIFRG